MVTKQCHHPHIIIIIIISVTQYASCYSHSSPPLSDVNETGTLETETETRSFETETETRTLETETGLETTMILKFLWPERDLHHHCFVFSLSLYALQLDLKLFGCLLYTSPSQRD